jgi:hypothetical protein
MAPGCRTVGDREPQKRARSVNKREFHERVADILAKQRGVKRAAAEKKPPQSEQKFKLNVRRSKAG